MLQFQKQLFNMNLKEKGEENVNIIKHASQIEA